MEARIRHLQELLHTAKVGETPTESGTAVPGTVLTVRFEGDDTVRVVAGWGRLGEVVPVFFLAYLLKLVFAVWLNVLPVAGRATTRSILTMKTQGAGTGVYLIDAISTGDPAVVGDVLQHAVLPAVALALAIPLLVAYPITRSRHADIVRGTGPS